MTTFTFNRLGNYRNNGQDIEQSIRFELTGDLCKADNLAHHLGGDCLNFQIKSARATVCKGTDLKAYLDMDAATAYIYGTLEGKGYIMSREEYELFCGEFATVTADSRKNGGELKLRLKHESKALLEWLEARV